MATLHHTSEDFYDAIYGDTVTIRDGIARLWLAFESEDGDWFAVRPRHEEDGRGSEKDPWRPIGPLPLDKVPLPWLASIPDYRSTDQEAAHVMQEPSITDLRWSCSGCDWTRIGAFTTAEERAASFAIEHQSTDPGCGCSTNPARARYADGDPAGCYCTCSDDAREGCEHEPDEPQSSDQEASS